MPLYSSQIKADNLVVLCNMYEIIYIISTLTLNNQARGTWRGRVRWETEI